MAWAKPRTSIQTKDFNPNTGWLEKGKLSASGKPDRVQEVYEYDALSNVTKRAQTWDTLGFVETFGYDDLNRLSSSQVANREATAQRFTYDATGNILSKSNVANAASYIYPATGNARPHAVKSIGSGLSFQYDDNGNLLSGASRSISWTSFDMPERISKGSVSANFEYGVEHQRIKQSRSDGSVVIYAGAQEVETQGGKVTVKTYWPLGIGLEIDKDGASPQLLWQHTDRLGSPIALTDQAGNVKEKLAYDAWGKRRSPDGSAINGSATPDSLDGVQDNRGYTGHEMLDQLDLVHMNGRVYDPLTVRFLSADPYVTEPLTPCVRLVVASPIPFSRANCDTDLFVGGIICFKIASFLSAEYRFKIAPFTRTSDRLFHSRVTRQLV